MLVMAGFLANLVDAWPRPRFCPLQHRDHIGPSRCSTYHGWAALMLVGPWPFAGATPGPRAFVPQNGPGPK